MTALETVAFAPGGYRYVRGPFQYSAGVAAEPGFGIERVRFAAHTPLAEGFRAVEKYLTAIGRPPTAFCACELRSPAPFTESGFHAFNRSYVDTLERWGLFRKEANPVARSNVCPEIDPPAEPGFHAFSYTVPRRGDDAAWQPFVISGSAEVSEGPGSYGDRIVRPGDCSPDGLREKARFVWSALEARMAALGVDSSRASATQVYTVHGPSPALVAELVGRGAARAGLTWHYARPPVEGLDYEMDVRGVRTERVI